MPSPGPDSFDVFELDHPKDSGAGADEIQTGSQREPRAPGPLRTRWASTDESHRRLVGVTAVALAVTTLALIGALRADPVVHRLTQVTTVPAPTVSVDALGCPNARRCITDIAPAAVRAAAGQALPQGRVTYAMRETDAGTGEVYRIVLFIAAHDTTIQVRSQCVPAAAPVVDLPLAVSRVDGSVVTPIAIDQPTPAGLKLWTITLASSQPSSDGCGINVAAESTLTQGINGQAIDTVVNLLADDPRLMADR